MWLDGDALLLLGPILESVASLGPYTDVHVSVREWAPLFSISKAVAYRGTFRAFGHSFADWCFLIVSKRSPKVELDSVTCSPP